MTNQSATCVSLWNLVCD